MVYSLKNDPVRLETCPEQCRRGRGYIDMSVLSSPACVADNVNTGFVNVTSKKDDFMYFAGMGFFGEQFASLWVWLAQRDLEKGKEATAEGKKGGAVKYFEDAVKKFHTANIRIGELSTLRLLADAYFAAGRMDQAYNTYLQLMKEAASGRWTIPADEMGFLNIGLVSAAEIYLDQQMNFKTYEAGQAVEANQFEKAEALLKEALEIRETARGYGINTDYFISAEKRVELKDLIEKLNSFPEAAVGQPARGQGASKSGGSLFKHGLLAMAYDVLDLEHRRVEYALYAKDLLDAAEGFEGKLPRQARELLERARFALNRCTGAEQYGELDSSLLKAGNRNDAQMSQMTATGVALQLRTRNRAAKILPYERMAIAMLKSGQLAEAMIQLRVAARDYAAKGFDADAVEVNVIHADLVMTLESDYFAEDALRAYEDAVNLYEDSGDVDNLKRVQKKLKMAKLLCAVKAVNGMLDSALDASSGGQTFEQLHEAVVKNYRSAPKALSAELLAPDKIARTRALAQKYYQMAADAPLDQAVAYRELAIKLDLLSSRPVGEFGVEINVQIHELLRQIKMTWGDKEAYDKLAVEFVNLNLLLQENKLTDHGSFETLRLFAEAGEYRKADSVPTMEIGSVLLEAGLPVPAELYNRLELYTNEAYSLTTGANGRHTFKTVGNYIDVMYALKVADSQFEWPEGSDVVQRRLSDMMTRFIAERGELLLYAVDDGLNTSANVDINLYVARLNNQIAKLSIVLGRPADETHTFIDGQIEYMKKAAQHETDPLRRSEILAGISFVESWRENKGVSLRPAELRTARAETATYERGIISEAARALGKRDNRNDRVEEKAAAEVRAEMMQKVREGVERAAKAVEKDGKPK